MIKPLSFTFQEGLLKKGISPQFIFALRFARFFGGETALCDYDLTKTVETPVDFKNPKVGDTLCHAYLYTPEFTNMTGWKIPIFNRKYIFNLGPFSIAVLVYRTVVMYYNVLHPRFFWSI